MTRDDRERRRHERQVRYREIITMRKDGRTMPEIAAELGISKQRVHQILSDPPPAPPYTNAEEKLAAAVLQDARAIVSCAERGRVDAVLAVARGIAATLQEAEWRPTPDPKECGVCGDYTMGGVEVHEECLAECNTLKMHVVAP